MILFYGDLNLRCSLQLKRFLVTVDAFAVFEELFDSSLREGEAMWISTFQCFVLFAYSASVVNALGLEQHKDQSHSDISAESRLLKVVRSGIVVNIHVYLIYSGERMEDRKRGFCKLKLT